MTLKAPGKPRFTLFPTIHVADAAFFTQVRAEAATHELVLVEGVNAPAVRWISRSYRLLTGGSAALSYQGDHMSVQDFPKWDRADMDRETFTARWRALPLWLRLCLFVLLPIAWIILRVKGTRRMLTRALGAIDSEHGIARDSADPIDQDSAVGKLRDLILRQRDEVLIARCDAAIAEGSDQSIAVIYGAAHMAALIRYLRDQHGYQIVASDWMMAIRA